LLRAVLLAALACLLMIALPSPAAAADRDCADFAPPAAAEAWRPAYPGDPDGLAGDADGVACESLPCPCARAGATPVPPAPAPPPPPGATPAPVAKALEVKARVTSVIDGDTLKVRFADGAKATVRLIGIDTPETKKPGTPVQCGGRAATTRMKALALRNGTGRTVTITTDPTQDLTDRYGRLLAYVGAGGTDFGRTMVSAGWAKTYVYRVDFQRVGAYRAAQRSAKSAGRGVFRRCAGAFHRS
jgi:endonuclease YncB( thermonuclease family)